MSVRPAPARVRRFGWAAPFPAPPPSRMRSHHRFRTSLCPGPTTSRGARSSPDGWRSPHVRSISSTRRACFGLDFRCVARCLPSQLSHCADNTFLPFVAPFNRLQHAADRMKLGGCRLLALESLVDAFGDAVRRGDSHLAIHLRLHFLCLLDPRLYSHAGVGAPLLVALVGEACKPGVTLLAIGDNSETAVAEVRVDPVGAQMTMLRPSKDQPSADRSSGRSVAFAAGCQKTSKSSLQSIKMNSRPALDQLPNRIACHPGSKRCTYQSRQSASNGSHIAPSPV
jgi:hypothetical protein